MPQALGTLVVDLLARVTQKGCDMAIPVLTRMAHQLDRVGSQPVFASTSNWQPPLRGPMLTQNRADPPLGHPHLVTNVINASPET